jgi:hypothetical protein
MLRSIALMVHVSPRDTQASDLTISDLETSRPLRLEPNVFVVTLEWDSTESYSRGRLEWVAKRTSYPIQSNAAFFEALLAFAGHAASDG